MITKDDLNKIDNHWTLSSFDNQFVSTVFSKVKQMSAQNDIGNVIQFNFSNEDEFINDIFKLSSAYETASIEYMNDFIKNGSNRNLFIASSWKLFELIKNLPLPDSKNDLIYHVLHLSSVAYCSERWNELRNWYPKKKLQKIKQESYSNWDDTVLSAIAEIWTILFTKSNWNEIEQVSKKIVELRNVQNIREPNYLENNKNYSSAYSLLSLYHLAKATEVLSIYTLQGTPNNIKIELEKHFELSINSAKLANDVQLELLIRWLYCSSLQMIDASVWWIARTINSRTTKFVEHITKANGIFELLPPQKSAIRENGLLDPATLAIAVELPTSGGKTLLAEFKILQALNQFSSDYGWVAYIAPTKALVSQITRRLRKDFSPQIKVEQLSSSVDIDEIEDDILNSKSFDILVSTPEKMNLVIRSKKIKRPLALVVMDEAHNIEDVERGLRMELLLATIKEDCANANFLLLMPFVDNAIDLARWLASDFSSSKSISIASTPWRPNEKIIGLISKKKTHHGLDELFFEVILNDKSSFDFNENYKIKDVEKKVNSKYQYVLESALDFSVNGTCLAISRTKRDSWKMARELSIKMPVSETKDNDIELVKNFLRTEINENYELVNLLDRGIGVHNSGLSDETKELIEWLAEQGKLKILCATTTIAQGINFPVSSVIIQSISKPSTIRSIDMTPREFWNLAGRAGRIGQSNTGIVGLAVDDDREKLLKFLSTSTGDLISRMVDLIDKSLSYKEEVNLDVFFNGKEWNDYRSYIAHLCVQKDNIDKLLVDVENLLRSTYGFNILRKTPNGEQKANILVEATKRYINKIKDYPSHVLPLADQTGFSPEGIIKASIEMNSLNHKFNKEDFTIKGMFDSNYSLANLYGVMMRLPELKESLSGFSDGGQKRTKIADITIDWVTGKSIKEIALKYFDGQGTNELSEAYSALNQSISYAGSWGLSVLTKMTGIDLEELSEEERTELLNLPSMIYHGVNSTTAVMMRVNYVPRSIANKLANKYDTENTLSKDMSQIREFIRKLKPEDWNSLRDMNSFLTGENYYRLWRILSGEN